jgi:outer membrane protein assembly factor BamD (BamD/ComL family)
MGQSLKGSMSKYDKGDFEDAAEGFRKILCENPGDIIANMGMGLICANNGILLIPAIKDQYNIFDAFRYIRKSKKAIDKLTETELTEINTTIKTIPNVKEKVTSAYATIEEQLYKQVLLRQNLDSTNLFINEFVDSKYFKHILQIRNNAFFNKVKGSDSVEALNDFILRCPGADSLQAAIMLRNLAAYNKLMGNARSLEDVYDYLNRYPNSQQYYMVIGLRDNLEFEEAKKEGTFSAFNFFFENFPKSSQAPLLRNKYIEMSYNESRKQNTIAGYNDFLNRFPLAKPFAQSARNDRDSLCFHVFSNTIDSLNKFITSFPDSKFTEAAVRLRDQKAFDMAKSENEIVSFEKYIYRYPSAIQVSEALVLRDSLVLDQVRFLSSEKDFNDFLSDYPYLIHLPKTMGILEKVLYLEAKKIDNYEIYQEFLDRCPRSENVAEIEELMKKKGKPVSN